MSQPEPFHAFRDQQRSAVFLPSGKTTPAPSLKIWAAAAVSTSLKENIVTRHRNVTGEGELRSKGRDGKEQTTVATENGKCSLGKEGRGRFRLKVGRSKM